VELAATASPVFIETGQFPGIRPIGEKLECDESGLIDSATSAASAA
jgi:hypothetical protein